MKKKKIILIGGVLALIVAVVVGIFLYENENQVKIVKFNVKPYKKVIKKTDYDVIVVGGEPEGVSAAVSAARNGLKVLLIEERKSLGGLMTYGMLNYLDIPENKRGQVTAQGIFKEWHNMVGGPKVNTVDIDTAQRSFLKLIQNEKNITLSLTTKLKGVNVKNNQITSITVQDEKGTHIYSAKRFIDCTPDADLATMSKVPNFIGQQDIGVNQKMSVTLVIDLKNVNWNEVKQAASSGKYGPSGANEYAAWGFQGLVNQYQELYEDTNLRGLNVGRTPKGEVFINALQIFNIDGIDQTSKERGILIGEKESVNIVQWLRKNLPGFENADIERYPSELYVRETRHIKALYQLPISDVWENKNHSDDIAIGSYPTDMQATSKANPGTVIVKPNQYGIPFRSLVPQKIVNLLVASKASGYSSLAAGSARVIPTGMAVAQAAGVATQISIEHHEMFPNLAESETDIQELRNTLLDQGAYITALNNPDYPYKNDPIYPSLKLLYTYGLISAGYTNDFGLDTPMTNLSFVRMMLGGIERINPAAYQVNRNVYQQLATNTPATPLNSISLQDLAYKITGEMSKHSLPANKTLTRKEAYPSIAELLKKYQN